MATHTRAELPVIFDCNIGEDGLAEFEPEAQRGAAQAARPAGRRWPRAVPVVIAAVIAGGAVSWLRISTETGELPSTPRPSVSSEVSAGEPALANAVTALQQTAPATPRAVATPPVPPAVDPALERTLARVSESYRALDATSLSVVWPGVDTETLSRDFAGLKYQRLSFDRCAVRPNDAAGAVATCEVTRAMAPNEGDPSLQRRHESWTLVLDRSAGDRWTITGASVR